MSDNNSDFETVEVIRNYNNADCSLYGCDADLIKIRLWEDESNWTPTEVIRLCRDPDCDFHSREVKDDSGYLIQREISGIYDGTLSRNPRAEVSDD